VKKGKHQTSYSTAAAFHTETFAGPDPFKNHTGITLNIKHCCAAFCAVYLKESLNKYQKPFVTWRIAFFNKQKKLYRHQIISSRNSE